MVASSQLDFLARRQNVRSSHADAISQLNKWESESARVLVSASGLVTVWFHGKVAGASPVEVHFQIPGIDCKNFVVSLSLRDASFEYRDSREATDFAPLRDESYFESLLEIRLSDGKLIMVARLHEREPKSK